MPEPINFSALVGAVGDAICTSDVAGAITSWNSGAERMFGFTTAEAMGQSLDIIIPERLRKRHWDGYHETMASGVTKYGHDVLRVPAIDKAGRALSIAFTVVMLHDGAGKVSGIGSVMRDETERFNRDRAMRKRLAELEALVAAGGASAAGATVAVADVPEEPSGCPMAGAKRE
jgi:PAS domain S-box-containing protein